MCNARSNRQVGSYAAASLPEVKQKTHNGRLLGTVAFVLVKRPGAGGICIQLQAVPVPQEISLHADVVVHMGAGKEIERSSVCRGIRGKIQALRPTL